MLPPRRPSSRLAGGLALAAALAFTAGCRPKPQAAPPPAPAHVVLAPVVQRDEPIRAEWVATVDGLVNASIRAQVSGYLLKQVYQDGTEVKKGDVLFEIDRRPFEAALMQVQAHYDQAELTRQRQSQLSTEQAVSAQERDAAINAAAAAKGALEQAKLALEFTRITSPIDGLAGIASAQIGDLVGPATGVLTTVSTLDPIKVYFSISEQTYLDFNRAGAGEPRFPQNLVFDLVMADGTVYPHPGRFLAADRQIDPGTGTLRLAGVVPNPQRLLRPGQYARVRATIRTERGALLVPQRSVNELQGGYQVAVVGDDNVAHLRNVKVGERSGSLWIIREGLHPGDRVVVDGIQKVKDGAPVHPVNPAQAD